ncbi:hypothetical protein SAMN04488056_102523 [Cohaesibacter marisflavi]|uniref:Uncharacterized protein n=1 Tax=Cohaesibacter marisflavi TaxID=655353 RepID=A0A1I5D9C8_9HYPH|nr:hypothetical protein SAMN04488056_102523 [Cohaesibacter marisflavi]
MRTNYRYTGVISSLKSHKAEHRHQHEIVPHLWSALKSRGTGHNDE